LNSVAIDDDDTQLDEHTQKLLEFYSSYFDWQTLPQVL
jgi:hypothetical protein